MVLAKPCLNLMSNDAIWGQKHSVSAFDRVEPTCRLIKASTGSRTTETVVFLPCFPSRRNESTVSMGNSEDNSGTKDYVCPGCFYASDFLARKPAPFLLKTDPFCTGVILC